MSDSVVPAVKAGRPSGRTAGFSISLRKPAVRYALAAVGLVAAIAAAVFIYSNRPINVQVATVEQNVPIRVFGLGTTEARVLSKIGFEVGATLAELHADHGDRVGKGQVLARLSTGEQDAKVAKARAALLIAGVNIAKSAANLEKARAVFIQKQETNRRKQALAGRDVVSQQAAEEAIRDEAVAKADVDVAESEVESVKAQLTDTRAQLQYEETMLRHRTLVAPFDAVVVERHKELGSVIKAGDPIFTLIAVGSYWGLAHVDEARAGFIEEGQPVEARLRSRPLESFTGRVVRIGLESDRVTEERRVYLRGENPPARVYLGEQVEFWITVANLDKALLVPSAAVHGYDGRQGTVWTVEEGRLRRRLVQFRHRTEDARLEIVGGLPENARVVTQLESGLLEGRAARVAKAMSK
ncbi:MAG: efflux RND transporter periplasmic adaptor subunit [Rhizobiales bacterium]|jgi:HlyD family secretion protein|nr:efflux RND transporter periplasmic adaptor subunit [Hyphomicrobiales bacterium]